MPDLATVDIYAPAFWLPPLWALVLGAAVTLYVVLDGFTLGLGILFPLSPEEERRDVMMNSVAPFWDGNGTWLVLGGGGLFVAFPKAYAIIMPALYLPIIIMLLALVFRGVAFEFRWVAKPHHRKWDFAFAWGSIVATFMQGVILGGLLQGVAITGSAFSGGPLDWLTPFPIAVGMILVFGYALLGATWLVMKTEGEIAAAARYQALAALPVVLGGMALVSLWTPYALPRIAERWFTWPNIVYLAPVPILTALVAFVCWRSLQSRRDTLPFVSAIGLFLLGLTGLVISNAPYLVPPSMTVWDAAADAKSQMFSIIGVAIMLPVVLGYTAFVYWTFRGKVRIGEGYH